MDNLQKILSAHSQACCYWLLTAGCQPYAVLSSIGDPRQQARCAWLHNDFYPTARWGWRYPLSLAWEPETWETQTGPPAPSR